MELKTFFTYIEGLKDETYNEIKAFNKQYTIVEALSMYRSAGFTLTDVDKIYVETKKKYMAPEIVGVFDINLNEFYGPWPQWAPSASKKVSDGNSSNFTKSYKCSRLLTGTIYTEVQASSPAEAAAFYVHMNLATPCNVYVDDKKYAVQKWETTSDYTCALWCGDNDPWWEETQWEGPFSAADLSTTSLYNTSSVPSDDPSISYVSLGQEVGALVDEKQKQYGDSFGKAHKILASLYPNGVRPDQYTDMLACVRIIDKLFRIAQRKQDGQDLGGESPYRDVAGYGLLGLKKDTDAVSSATGADAGASNACNFDDTDDDGWDRDY